MAVRFLDKYAKGFYSDGEYSRVKELLVPADAKLRAERTAAAQHRGCAQPLTGCCFMLASPCFSVKYTAPGRYGFYML